MLYKSLGPALHKLPFLYLVCLFKHFNLCIFLNFFGLDKRGVFPHPPDYVGV